MSGKYARQHAAALAKIQAKGAPAIFTRKGVGTVDDATDIETPAVDVVVPCVAIAVAKNPQMYEKLGLVMTDAPMLEAVPLNYGDAIPVGASVSWAGIDYVVKSALPLAPDGVTILAKVVVSR